MKVSSIKPGLDIDWSAPDAKDRLMEWVGKQPLACIDAPMTRYIEALTQALEGRAAGHLACSPGGGEGARSRRT